MTIESTVKVTYTINLSSVCNANSSLIFWSMVFIFGTTIAFGVKITTNALEYGYDLGAQCQGQISLKST